MAENMSVEVEETTVTPITDSSTASTDVTKRKRDISSRSEYWKSFEKFTKGTDTMARCLYCKREIRANSQNETAPLKNHLLACRAKHISDSMQPELVGMGLHGEKFLVTDGLHLCEAAVSKVRLAVKYVKSSPGRYALFKSAIALEDIQYKGWLSLDVKTRWNSTYKMLDAAQKFQKAFERFEDMDPLFKFTLRDDDNNSLVPTYEDWEKVKKLVAILRRFYNLTLKVSGYKSVSSHSFFDDAANLHIIFQQWKDSDDFSLTDMALPMCEKYEKYWGEDKMNLLFYIAVGLDPRKKLRFLRFTLTDMYGRHKGDALFEKVNKALYDLFDEYKCKFGPSLLTPSSSIDSFRTSNLNSDGDEDDDERMTTQRINRFKIQELGVGENNKSELDKYLGEDLEDDSKEFDILSWWKILSSRFPILGHMARDVLAVPVSTVASEATFSTGGRILDAFRSSLSARTVQSLLCAQDWLRGQSSQINFKEDHDEMEALEDGFSSMGIDVYNKYID